MKNSKKIIFSLAICCIFLICLEIICRIILGFVYQEDKYKLYSDFFPQHAMYMEDRYLFWKGNPNWEGIWCGIGVNLNSYGLRDVEFPMHKPRNTYRILSLGESGTFGSTVPLEDTYNKQLEVLLNKNDENSKSSFQVINAAQLSYSSFQGLLYLKRYGLDFEPNLVMTYFEFNDRLSSYFVMTDKQTGFGDLLDYRKAGPGVTDRQLFYRRQKFIFRIYKVLNKSSIYRSLSGLILNIKSSFIFRNKGKNDEGKGNLKMSTRPVRVPEEDRKWIFSQFISIAQRHNIKLLILIPPYTPYIYKDNTYRPFSWITPSDNVYILDLGKAFKKSPYSHDELFSDDIHPTVLGNRIIAEAVFGFLITQVFKD
ncbi:MAG: hypothetical protein ISS47_01340 [Candidatus Omnitrophica bacterium]|nr:hypothetical protein [Candidatus Omnitrophota bacterium]